MKFSITRSVRLLNIGLWCIVGITKVQAQTKSPSALARYYLGEMRSAKLAEQIAMGGVGIASAYAGQYNLQNPASPATLTMTSMGSGGMHTQIFVEDRRGNTDHAQNGGPQYVYLAFPMGKRFGLGISLTPYSSMGYDYISRIGKEGDYDRISEFKGEGGVSEIEMSLAFKLSDNWSVGVSGGILFGSSTRTASYLIKEATFNSDSEEKLNFIAPNMRIGLLGRIDINENQAITLGLVAHIGQDGEQDFTLKQRLFQNTNTERSYVLLDTVQAIKVGLPSEYGIGIAHNYENKLKTEFNLRWKSEASSPRLGKLHESLMYNLGFNFTPRVNSIDSYFERMSYLLGGYYGTNGVVFQGHEMYDMGVSAGLKIPFFRDRNSFLTVGVGYGLREFNGTNVLRETYFNAYLGITINQLWFIERKYD